MEPDKVKGVNLFSTAGVTFMMAIGEGIIVIDDQSPEAAGTGKGIPFIGPVYRLIDIRQKSLYGLTDGKAATK
jgi:hypothetical protein